MKNFVTLKSSNFSLQNKSIHGFLNKVRYVARLIYERTSRVIGLNVVYLLMFNRHNTKHVCVREREGERERERERESVCAHNGERGVP